MNIIFASVLAVVITIFVISWPVWFWVAYRTINPEPGNARADAFTEIGWPVLYSCLLFIGGAFLMQHIFGA